MTSVNVAYNTRFITSTDEAEFTAAIGNTLSNMKQMAKPKDQVSIEYQTTLIKAGKIQYSAIIYLNTL